MTPSDLALDDPDALREQALSLLRGLAGDTWTDHNAHDPGITLLEALCYALTDLGYRIAHPVADLMAEQALPGEATDPAARGLWTAAQVLAGGAVTPDDLRRLAIDVPGVKNAWIEVLDLPLARHDAAQGLVLPPDDTAAQGATPSPNISALRPQGLLAVRIEKSGLGEDIDGGTIARDVARQLHRWRGLGQDLVQMEVLETQRVPLALTLDIAPEADPATLLAAVITALADHLSPPVPFRTLAEMQARGRRVDQVFDGPLLRHGFLDRVEFDALARRSSVRLSDLVQVLMRVPGVRAVVQIAFLVDGRPSGDWLLAIDPRRTAALDLDGSRLRLERRQVRVDDASVRQIARRQVEAALRERAAAMAAAARSNARDLPLPEGRSRQVARYRSVQHHLPRVYGVGPDGLPASATPQRRAQAAQLKAYVLFFDQLLANQHAQLAGVSRLLAFDAAAQVEPRAAFSRLVGDDGDPLGLTALRLGSPEVQAARLQALAADPQGQDDGRLALLQRHRQADHLLARAGERLGPHVPRSDRVLPGERPEAALLRGKLALLRALPRLGRRRGAGADALADLPADAAADGPADAADDTDATDDAAWQDGLSLRLALTLGVGRDTGADAHGAAAAEPEPLRLIEHILLRPLPEDAAQDGPLMVAAASADPYSLQLTAALDGEAGRAADADFRRLVEQTLRDHLPVHLGLRVLWLDAPAMAALVAAHDRWWPLWCASRRQAFGLTAQAADAGSQADVLAARQLPLRSARNRLIDRLGLGDTAPLTDVPLGSAAEGPIKVPHGGLARIVIAYAEAGVRYELRGPGGAPLRGAQGQPLPAVTQDGQDGPAALESPPVTEDITFRVLATKIGSAQAPRLLSQPVPVKVGLDTTLAVDAPGVPWLDPLLPSPQPADARLVPFGAVITVTVQASQEGVAYALVIDGHVQADSQLGDLATLELRTPPLHEDTLIAVQASKSFPGGGGQQEVQLLDARLVVCVRANPALVLHLLPGDVAEFRAAGLAVQVDGAQASARYSVWQRRVLDREFVRDAAPDDPALVHSTQPGLPAVTRPVAAPPDGPPPAGYTPLAGDPSAVGAGGDDAVTVEAPGVPGDGQRALLPLPAFDDDTVLLVAAAKLHQPPAKPGDTVRAIRSLVWLAQPLLLLVRPDPARVLALQWRQTPAGQALTLQGGQPGVFYTAQAAGATDAQAAALARPGYFHQRDALQPALNKGLGQLGVAIDFVVAADPPRRPEPGVDALDVWPVQSPSLLLAAPLPVGGRLAWQAVKAQTGLDVMLQATTPVPGLPQARLVPPFPAPGASAELQVTASDAAQHYRLQWPALPDGDASEGMAPGDAVPGNGDTLNLAVPGLADDAWLALWVQPAAEAGTLPLQRVLVLPVLRLPRNDLALAADSESVPAGKRLWLRLSDSQPGVLYQLLVGDQPLGQPVAGQGGELLLDTGPIAADTEFAVSATRADAPAAQVRLLATLRIAIEAP